MKRSPCLRTRPQDVARLEAQEVGILLLQRGFDLVPGDRGRNRRVVAAAQGVHGDGGLRAVVLAPVDEHLALAQLLLHLRDDVLRVVALERLGDRVRERLGLLVGDLRVQRDVELKALGARRLGERLEAEVLEHRLDREADTAAVEDVGGRAGVEVEDQAGGALDVLGERERRVQLQRRQLRQPDQRGEVVADDEVQQALAPELQRRRVHPVGRVRGGALLVERLVGNAVWEAHPRKGSAPPGGAGSPGRSARSSRWPRPW